MFACTDERTSVAETLSVLTFNILADCWVNLSGDHRYYNAHFPKADGRSVPPQLLDVTQRRSIILERIIDANADAVCLQEIEALRPCFKHCDLDICLSYASGNWQLVRHGEILYKIASKAATPCGIMGVWEAWEGGEAHIQIRRESDNTKVHIEHPANTEVEGCYELTEQTGNEDNDIISFLTAKLGDSYHILAPAMNVFTSSENNNGVVVLVRKSSFDGNPTADHITVDAEEGTAATVVLCKCNGSAKNLALVSCHLDSGCGEKQGGAVMEHLQSLGRAADALIWCGDFNMSPQTHQKFFDHVREQNFQDAFDFDPELHTQHLAFRLSDRRDYILYKGLQLLSKRAFLAEGVEAGAAQMDRCEANLAFVGSDHTPLAATFTWAGGASAPTASGGTEALSS
jgi:endonuclease/exonuclease/phosphatase family metal-dependent hydrolase